MVEKIPTVKAPLHKLHTVLCKKDEPLIKHWMNLNQQGLYGWILFNFKWRCKKRHNCYLKLLYFFLYESQELLQIQSHEMLKIAELSKVCVYMKVFKQIQHFFPLLILHRVVMEPIPGNLEHRAGVPTHYRAQVKWDYRHSKACRTCRYLQ